MQTFTPAKLSSNRVKTPEGFLLCKDVTFARTGEMLYGAQETIYGAGKIPVRPGTDGVARITRDESVLFDQATLDSFVGKSITVRHPPTLVSGGSWRTVEAGTILNARRGTGAKSEFMVGDIIVKDQETVDMMDGFTPEVSTGYIARYEDLGSGRGRQIKITGNHLAILPRGIQGRGGRECYVGDEDECYIGDQAMDIVEEPTMTTNSGLALIKKLFGAKDDAAVSDILNAATTDEAVAAAVTAATAPLQVQIDALTTDNAALTAKLGDKDEVVTLDAATVTASHARVVAAAEILAPGTQVATFDAADLAASTESALTAQRTALTAASTNPKTKPYIDAMLGGADIGAMTADQLGANFFAAAGMVGIANNNVLAGALLASLGEGAGANAVKTNIERSAEADKASKDKWAAIRAARNAH